jgi:cyclopropane-fatty-acyl-phospholipid synthase
MAVAEIGSDWDRPFHRRACDGHNISPSQISVARERAQAAEVSEVDYRKRSRRFDRVVSVGITEHVGIGHSPKNLAGPANCRLKTAKRSSTASAASHPGTTGQFIREYIFPSVYTPSLSEVLAANEHAASGSLTWKCCAVTTITHSRTGSTALPRAERRWSPFSANGPAA